MKKNQEQVDFAHQLRRKQTRAEAFLWARLKSKQLNGVKFRRQQPIGPYIVDFVSFEKKLILEIDGGQHNEEGAGRKKDEDRTKWLQESGYQVLRFWNNEVLMNTEAVLQKIMMALE